MSTADAVARETAWLRDYSPTDGLPNLLAPTGPWTVIQAYVPRVTAERQTGIYVLRHQFKIARFANVRSMTTHHFRLKLVWPLSSGSGSAESDLQAFDNAIDLLLQRIAGPIGDKTHGGRFLSVAESHDHITVDQDDPDVTIPATAQFFGTVTYSADDQEFAN